MEFKCSSSSSSFPHQNLKPKRNYDVFISFRGSDTRRRFVCHLYRALSAAGVNAFYDEETLPKGQRLQELISAIEGSQISIVVFSKNYAESDWCLDELEKILECHRVHGHCVVPVFYYVQPSEVRNQSGAFGKALTAAVRKRFSEDQRNAVLSKWSVALFQAASLSGWNAMQCRNEAELVEEIVNDVLTKLEYEVLSNTEFPVGLESRIQKVIRLAETQSTKVCTIGIWGMGGSGKTTFAKAIYNRIHSRFTNKSFLEDIREICQTDARGYVILQNTLLSDVLKMKVEVSGVSMGTYMIQKRLAGKKALIVLDDVNEFDQLEALCGNCKWLGQGSLIIITTRNLRLLDQFKVDFVYKMEEMNENDSLALFSWHAFGEAEPGKDFSKLAKDAVAHCGGLPLAIEVLGSYLCKRKKKEWESLLAKLQIIPNAKVQKILKKSFDDLSDEMEKDIFLDVCCVFIGKDRGYVTEILNDCGLPAGIGITVLIECSLIKVDKNNKLGMHRLLRHMGREIISESSTKEPGECSRLWFQKDVLDVLTKNTGTKAIVGMALNLHLNDRDCIHADAFEEMKNLRLLLVDNVPFTGDYGYLSEQLRWIFWQGFPLEYMPNNLFLERVIAIDFKRSNLRILWNEPKVLLCLKILNLSHSKHLTETPDFSKLPNLEKLILKHCPSLYQVHKSIGDLRNLLLINLKGCTNLSKLPRETYKLKCLKILILSGCSKIDKLEEDIGQMKSLTTLIAENIAVKQVPFSILSSKRIGYISLCEFGGLPLGVFTSIIWSYMSRTINPLSCIHPFCGISPSPLFMNMKDGDLGDLAPILSSILNLRSVFVQCDEGFQISKQVRKVLDELHGVNSTKLQITLSTSEISNHSLKYHLIEIGGHQEVFNTLSNSISEGLATSESCDVYFPRDHYPYWFAHTGDERHSVYFTVPEECRLKGMALCVVYLSTPETTAIESLVSVSIINYTKCIIQIYKRDTVISFNDVDWQGIISHMGPRDEVEIFVSFMHGLVVMKTSVYLIYDECFDMEIKPISTQPIKKVRTLKRKNDRMFEPSMDLVYGNINQENNFTYGT